MYCSSLGRKGLEMAFTIEPVSGFKPGVGYGSQVTYASSPRGYSSGTAGNNKVSGGYSGLEKAIGYSASILKSGLYGGVNEIRKNKYKPMCPLCLGEKAVIAGYDN